MTIENVMFTGDENKKSYEKYKAKLKELVFRKWKYENTNNIRD